MLLQLERIQIAAAEMDKAELVLQYMLRPSIEECLNLWFGKSELTDQEISARFGADVALASKGHYDHWALDVEHPRLLVALAIMYRTWGNVLVNPRVGLLFLDFEKPRRIRINGTAQLLEDDPLRAEFPGAVFIVRVTADLIFPNCPRYLHEMKLLEHSVYAPRPQHVAPVPAWKTFKEFRDALPERDRREEPWSSCR